MKSLIIKNGNVVTPYDVLTGHSVRIEHGIITAIEPHDVIDDSLPVIDVSGSLVLPGIIDIHTDALEGEINPRPRADMPVEVAFHELERKMSGCGFTTVFHSLHLGYKVAEDAARSRYSRKEIFEKVHALSGGPTILKNKIHLRFEVSGIYAYETCFELMEQGCISLLSVMDHTPGQGQQSEEKFINYLVRQGRGLEDAKAHLQEVLARPKIEGEKLERLIKFAHQLQIPVASHDDDTVAKVKLMQGMGVDICEFPINAETAAYASQSNMHVVGGASNVLRGGSLSDNLNMTDAIKAGYIDILCSDYYPPAILHSMWKLVYEHGLPWNEVVKLTSFNPARSVNMHHTGSIETGKAADIIVVKANNKIPFVTHTLVDGNLVSQAAVQVKHQKEAIWL